MKRLRLILFGGLCGAMTLACSGPSTQVKRVNPDQVVDLSGKWNDSDANTVAQAMIEDCLARPWAGNFKAEKGRHPVVRLYPIRNRSSEHINTRFFTKQVEMELLNSGMLQVVADVEESGDTRFERTDQAKHASDTTAKQQQQETGSDFILNGWVISENDAVGGEEVRAYVTTMELINSETNVKVWLKVHKIKKVISRSEAEW